MSEQIIVKEITKLMNSSQVKTFYLFGIYNLPGRWKKC